MKQVDLTTKDGKILHEAYVHILNHLAHMVKEGPFEKELGFPGRPEVVTIKFWPHSDLSFQAKITEEGKLELWDLEE